MKKRDVFALNLSRADRQMLGTSCLITSQKGIHVLYSTCLDVLCTLYFKIKVLIPKQICEAKVVILFLRPLQLAQILHLHPGRSATVDHWVQFEQKSAVNEISLFSELHVFMTFAAESWQWMQDFKRSRWTKTSSACRSCHGLALQQLGSSPYPVDSCTV